MGLPLILQLVQPNGSSWSVPFHYLDNGKLGRKAVGTTGETKAIPTNMLRFTTALGDRWKQMVARKTDEPLSPRKKMVSYRVAMNSLHSWIHCCLNGKLTIREFMFPPPNEKNNVEK